MEPYIVAIIGVIGVILGALFSGVFQLFTTNKTIKNAEQQFGIQMEQTRKEFSTKLEQIQEEQKRAVITMASEKFEAENNRFYSELFKEIRLYDWLLNELHYLNNISHPKNKQIRMESVAYPHIENLIKDKVSDISLHQDIAKLLGALRCNIDLYNAALNRSVLPEVLEEALARIYKLIGPINDTLFKNYANSQSLLRKHEIAEAEKQLQQI